jgi:hypothetical protein
VEVVDQMQATRGKKQNKQRSDQSPKAQTTEKLIEDLITTINYMEM